ncbi:MAG: hypothetical protein ACXWAV_06560 [Chthoniobacterales bacterium]
MSEEKRKRPGLSAEVLVKSDAPFVTYAVFSKFGKPPAGFSACQTGSHAVNAIRSDCAIARAKKVRRVRRPRTTFDRFASDSYAGHRSIGVHSRRFVIESFSTARGQPHR